MPMSLFLYRKNGRRNLFCRAILKPKIMKTFRITGFTLLMMLVLSAKSQQKEVSVLSELKRFSDIQKLPEYVEGMPVSQFSSYDTTGKNDDGFSGKYSFIRRNPDSSLIIFEAKGKGVINRIWTPTPTDDMLDFYFDGHSKADFSIKFSDLFSGKVFPFVQPLCANQIGGYFSYVPIPYSKGCKIIFRGKKMQFYQIQWRALPKNARVKTFNPKLSAQEQQLLASLKKTWLKEAHTTADFTPQKTEAIPFDATLKPGETVTLADMNKPGRMAGLRFGPAKIFEGLNKQVDLRITWDDEQQPAIYVPVADFFGYAFGSISMQSLLIGTEANENYVYFPMPFDKKAKVELVYRSSPQNPQAEPIRIKGQVDFIAQKREPKTEGKFYAFWNKQVRAVSGKPHIFLEGKGRGHYVGTVLQAQGLRAGMTEFFEGDDSTVVDGKMLMHGTGSEDYFNGGWYALMDRWDRKMSLPLHGSLDYSLPFSRTGGYRLFVSDKMPFSQSIHHSIEHGPDGNRYPADYTSVAFYYAGAPLSTGKKPDNDLTKVYQPDTLMVYPQLMRLTMDGEITKDGDRFAAKNGGQLRIDLAEIPSGKYRLFADVETNPNGADVEFWQRQTKMNDGVSFSSAEKKEVKMMPLTPLNLNEFSNTVTFHFKKNEAKNSIVIRRLILVKE